MRPGFFLLLLSIMYFPLTGFTKSNPEGGGNVVIIGAGKSATLHATTSGAVAYQWYKDGVPVKLALQRDLVVREAGTYTVVGFNQESCPSEMSDPVEVKFSNNAKHDLWITAEDNSRSYGSDNPTFTFKFEGFVNGDDQSVLISKPIATTQATKKSGAGKYAIVTTGAASDKYNIHFKSGYLTITQAPLTVAAKNDTKFKDGQPYKPGKGVGFSGFLNNDTPDSLKGNLIYSGNAIGAINSGNYTILPEGLSSANYKINYVPGELTISDQSVDLGVQTYAETRSVGVGETFTYYISATNKTSKATSVQLTDILPQDIDFVKITGSTFGNAGYDRSNNTLTWLIGDFAANEKAVLELQVRSLKPGSIKNSVTISSAEKDSNPADNIAVDYKKINSLKIPNIFTPNGDGMNEAFVIPGLENYHDNEITIFNRAGSSIYQKKSYQNDWDGSNLSDGTYFYILKVKIGDDKTDIYKGYVTLLRSNINHLN
jgi:gliding motility-associated-like protein/uncharacterized repeat protein (TIGR01451 family)